MVCHAHKGTSRLTHECYPLDSRMSRPQAVGDGGSFFPGEQAAAGCRQDCARTARGDHGWEPSPRGSGPAAGCRGTPGRMPTVRGKGGGREPRQAGGRAGATAPRPPPRPRGRRAQPLATLEGPLPRCRPLRQDAAPEFEGRERLSPSLAARCRQNAQAGGRSSNLERGSRVFAALGPREGENLCRPSTRHCGRMPQCGGGRQRRCHLQASTAYRRCDRRRPSQRPAGRVPHPDVVT